MAKLTFSTLLACTLQMGFNPVFASTDPILREFSIQLCEFCDAPPPENFHVSDLASDFVTLIWEPAWANATQTLEVSIQENGNWIQLFENYNVPGNSYLLGNLESGFYQAIISTNCASGETSTYSTKIEFEIKIIDLTIAGRMPLNPIAVEDCEKIDYKNHEWVGFKVTEIATGEANYFEFQENTEGEYPQIKRVFYGHPIVAIDENGAYPVEADPHKKAYFTFLLVDIQDGNPDNWITIGYVECQNEPDPESLSLCKKDFYNNISWKSEYDFVAETAEGIVDDSYPNSGYSEKSSLDSFDINMLKIQNPFNEYLSVFFPPHLLKPGNVNATIKLFNTSKQELFSYELDVTSPQVSIPTSLILPGIYMFQLKMDHFSQTVIAIKSR